MEEGFDDYANIYNLVDGWLGWLGTGEVTLGDDDGEQSGLYPPCADIHMSLPDKTELGIGLRLSESEHKVDTELRFLFPDGVKVTTKVDGFYINMVSDIRSYEKRVVKPVFDVLYGHRV